ncbi:MAG: hypothetical protein K2Q10_00040 [Rhodospirillales bacterium]|nr:hypothetical protein [Rhodospirillales bacterium]
MFARLNLILRGVLAATMAAAVLVAPMTASADINKPQHLSNGGNEKVNKVKAKGYLDRDSKQSGYEAMQSNTIVNMGSKKAGTCNMNVGAPAPGQKAPKEVVVTAKDIINICK